MKSAIAFKYRNKGCGADYYYGYSTEQTAGVIESDSQLNTLPILFFDSVTTLIRQSYAFDRIFVIYLFRTVYRNEVFSEVSRIKGSQRFITIGAGAHPSGDPAGSLKYFDYVIRGDCEIAIAELVKKIIENTVNIEISGVWYNKDNEIINGGFTKPLDLNTVPPFAPKHNKFAPIEITRGCPWGCKFCCVPYLYGGKPRHRQMEEIIKWVKVARASNKKVINFLTPNGFCYGSVDGRKISVDKIEELLQNLADIEGIRPVFGNYLSNVRPDFVSDYLIELVKKYTCTRTIHMGGQSGSEKILEISHVGYKVDDIKNAVKIVKSKGLNASVDIIFGLPGETEDDRRETLDFIYYLISKGAIPRVHAFMPLPGTPFADRQAGTVPPNYRKILIRLAARKRMMIPFEYEEKPWL